MLSLPHQYAPIEVAIGERERALRNDVNNGLPRRLVEDGL